MYLQTGLVILFNENVKSCSVDLFHNMSKSNHCLHELLSSYCQRSDSLRARGRDFVLPVCFSNLHKQSFIVRCLLYIVCYQCIVFSFFYVRLSHIINEILCYCVIVPFLRATAGTAIARLSHRNSVCPSVRLSVTIRQKRCKLGSSNLHHRLPQRL